jgi:hypothetical protein
MPSESFILSLPSSLKIKPIISPFSFKTPTLAHPVWVTPLKSKVSPQGFAAGFALRGGFLPIFLKRLDEASGHNHNLKRRSQGAKCMKSRERKELNLAQRIGIKEELEMENTAKDQTPTKELDRLIEAGSNPARSTIFS